MAERTKPPARSSEEEILHQYYNQLLSNYYDPEELAVLLFADGIISSETKKTVTSDGGEEPTQTLLDAVLQAFQNAPDPEQTFQKLVAALRETSYDPVVDEMEGECAVSLEAVA